VNDAETKASDVTEPVPAETAPPSAAAATEADAPPRKRWYVIHTYSGHENKVRANLERAIQYARLQENFGEVLVATEDYAVMKAGKKRITKRKTFPSYVLVEMVMTDETRALVQNIPGVTHFIGDKNAAQLSETEVRRIRGQEVKEKSQVTADVPFKVGETVKVIDGPFADFVGSVDEINPERGKLRVLVSIFGRPTAVELDIAQVTNI
jgi:transcriptional antiterminator NusG